MDWIKLGARDVVNAVSALPDHRRDLFDPGLRAVVELAGGSWSELTREDREDDGAKQFSILVVEGTIYKNLIGREDCRHYVFFSSERPPDEPDLLHESEPALAVLPPVEDVAGLSTYLPVAALRPAYFESEGDFGM